jgi:hypothetical protein
MSGDNELHIPADERAERAVLGAIIVEPDCYPRAAAVVDGADFYSDANGKVFDACRVLAETGVAPDLVTIPEQLERDGTLALVGGVAYVASLAEGLPDPANVESYAAIVRACARKRRLLYLGQRLMAEAAGSNGDGLAAVQAELVEALGRDITGRSPMGGPELLAHLGVQCLSDISRERAPELLLGRLDQEGHTILFAAGGAGKGAVTCKWIAELVRAGIIVLIADYENHATEWSRRISSLGGPLALAGVYYVSPMAATWRGSRGAIWDNAADLRAVAETVHATYLVVDSIIPACGAVDPMKPEAASQYAAALQYIGLPALSLAHVTKTDDLRYPFGSVFWHNLARTTWSLAKAGSGGAHEVVLTHRKTNNHGSLGKFLITITWTDGLPVEVTERGYTPALADRIAEMLTGGPLTVAELVTSLNDSLDEGAEHFRPDSIRAALRRGASALPKRFSFTGKGTAARWSNAY